MSVELDGVFEERWEEYERLRNCGDAYSAAVRIAELANCLEHQRVSGAMTHRWQAKVRKAESERDEFAIVKGATAAVERLQGLLSGGGAYVYEEIMLAITIRVELELLRADKLGGSIGAGLEAIDEHLAEIRQSGAHRAVFSKALAAARKNWGIPLDTYWLSGGS